MKATRTAAKFALALFAGLLIHAGAGAQTGTIASGSATIVYDGPDADGIKATWRVNGVNESLRQGSYVRIGALSQETELSAPATESYVGDTATWTFTVGGIPITQTVAIAEGGGGSSCQLTKTTTFTNPVAGPISVAFFEYFDFDLGDTFGGDAASVVASPEWIQAQDGGRTGQLRGPGAVRFEIEEYSNLVAELKDGAATTLDSDTSGYDGSDWTGALEWSETIPALGQLVITSHASVNEPALPVELSGFEIN